MKRHLIAAWVLILIAVAVLGFAHSSNYYVATSTKTPVVTGGASNSDSTKTTIPAATTTSAPAKVVVVTPPKPLISADAYLVGNAETGEVYVSKSITTASPIASISKLFTALVTYANMDPNQIVTITQPMLDVYSNSYGFSLGEKFTLNELMYPLLIQSNNNIAEGIAQTYGYSLFIQKMNELVASLKMTKTHFKDASGLSSENISNAQDLFTFAKYLYSSQQPLLALTTTYSWTFATTSDHGAHLVQSTDPFIGDPHLIGGKTGRTDAAGETMLTIFKYELKGKTYPIAIIVLHADPGERQNDSVRLLFQAMAVINKNNP